MSDEERTETYYCFVSLTKNQAEELLRCVQAGFLGSAERKLREWTRLKNELRMVVNSFNSEAIDE